MSLYQRISTRLLVVIILLQLVSLYSFSPRGYTTSRLRFPTNFMSSKPNVSIEYCTGCKWLLRSAYLAQELLSTFEKDIGSVSLQPNNERPGGVFIVRVDGQKIWDRREEDTKGFPETKILKQLVRDVIHPSLSLGHSDNKVIELPAE